MDPYNGRKRIKFRRKIQRAGESQVSLSTAKRNHYLQMSPYLKQYTVRMFAKQRINGNK